jgi:hypothetical protein
MKADVAGLPGGAAGIDFNNAMVKPESCPQEEHHVADPANAENKG